MTSRALVELCAESHRLGLPFVSIRREWNFRTWYRDDSGVVAGFYGVRPFNAGEDYLGKDTDEARRALVKAAEAMKAPPPVIVPVEKPRRATASRKRSRP